MKVKVVRESRCQPKVLDVINLSGTKFGCGEAGVPGTEVREIAGLVLPGANQTTLSLKCASLAKFFRVN